MQNHKKAFTVHINTQQPHVCIYTNSQLYTQQALFTHAHAAFPCLHMYKQQSRFKHAQPAGPVIICMHNQQDTFNVCTNSRLRLHTKTIQSLFTRAHAAGRICTWTDFTCTSCGRVYRCAYSRSRLNIYKRKALLSYAKKF